MNEAKCTGPFSDARDCPVHRTVSAPPPDAVAKVVAAYQALRAREIAVFGPITIVHAGRCGDEMNALREAVAALAERPASERTSA